MQELLEVQMRLKEWFEPDDHQLRDLPGGGKWYFVPWQRVRERLDEVCPSWQVSYSDPTYIGDFCTVTCTITIMGVSRQGIGNAEIQLISSKGKDMSRGTPIERAVADAFKNAAEAFGVARYLDEQVDPKTKQAFVKYMHKAGRGDVAVNYHKNEGNISDRPTSNPPAMPFGQKPKPAAKKVEPAPTIPSDSVNDKANLNRFRALTRFMGLNGKPGDDAIKKAIAELFENRMSHELNSEECDRVIDQVLINYGASSFGSDTEARAAYMSGIRGDEMLSQASDQELAQEWLNLLTRSSQKVS